MSENKDKKHIFDEPKNVERLLMGFYASCVLLVVADFIIHRHTTIDLEKIPAFYAIYGFRERTSLGGSADHDMSVCVE